VNSRGAGKSEIGKVTGPYCAGGDGIFLPPPVLEVPLVLTVAALLGGGDKGEPFPEEDGLREDVGGGDRLDRVGGIEGFREGSASERARTRAGGGGGPALP
jgi:hypothetical protein